MKLKKKYIDLIKSDIGLHYAVAKATGKSWSTISRWCAERSEQLTLPAATNAIREYLKLPASSIIIEQA